MSKILEPNFEKVIQNRKNSAILEKLRDTLLPKLLSGEIRIPDVEKLIRDAEV
jgi:type I restriction enzyme S subunit